MRENLWVARRCWLLFVPLAIFFVLCLNYFLASGFFLHTNPYDAKRILEILLLLYTAGYFLLSRFARKEALNIYFKLPGVARLLLLLFFVLGLISAQFAAVPKMACLEVGFIFLLVLFGLFIVVQRINYGEYIDRLLISIVLLAVVSYELAFLVSYVGMVVHHSYVNYFPGFVNVRFFSQFQTWILPLLVVPLVYIADRRRFFYWVIYLLAVFWWALAFANGAKGMFLGLLVAVMVAGYIYRGGLKTWLRLQCEVVFAGAVFYYLFFLLLISFSAVSISAGSVVGRLILWKQALGMIVKHPLLGVGPMHFSHFINPIAAHPHNSLLLIGAEWGLPALLCVLVLSIWGLISWVRLFNARTLVSDDVQNIIPISLSVSIIAGIAYSFVSGVLVMPMSQVAMFLVLGWAGGVYFATRGVAELPIKIVAEIFLMFFIIAAVVGVIVGVVPVIFYLPQTEVSWIFKQVFTIKKAHVVFNPRFWIQGWF